MYDNYGIESVSDICIRDAKGTLITTWDKGTLITNSSFTDINSEEIRANDIYSNGHKVMTSEDFKIYDEKIKEYIAEQLNLVKDNKKQYIKMYDGEDY